MIRSVFTSQVAMKGFYGSRVLGHYKIIKIFENCEIIRPTFHKIDPSETIKIIHERDIILEPPLADTGEGPHTSECIRLK